MTLLEKVISGGQTGVDRAALDAAMKLGIDVGGWCPRGRRALDGVIPAKYPLTETRGRSYQTRTKWNVRDSDATLILCLDEPVGGTALTIQYCEQLGKPYKIHPLQAGGTVWLDGAEDPYAVLYWLNCQQFQVLNVAGPREEKHCPIYKRAYTFLFEFFQLTQKDDHVYEPAGGYSVMPKNTPLIPEVVY